MGRIVNLKINWFEDLIMNVFSVMLLINVKLQNHQIK